MITFEDLNVPGAPNLPLDVAQRIRETIEAESRARDRALAAVLRSAQNRLAAQRKFGSAEAVTEFEEIAKEEMGIRVQLAWHAIRSAYLSLVGAPTAQMDACLSSELSERAIEQIKAVEDLVLRAARIAPFQNDHFRRAVLNAATDFIEDAWTEIESFSHRSFWSARGVPEFSRPGDTRSRGHNRTH